MGLAGQPFDVAHGRPFDVARGSHSDRGYAMAALLVGMSVMAVLMTALLPAWTHMATREKEEEMIFRGKQYARAIGLWQRKYANTPPPSIDILVEQRFLRKKYKDPITKDDFQPIYANQALQQGISAPQGAARPGQQSATLSTPAQQSAQAGVNSGTTPQGATAQGGIIGVTSKSKEASIKIYNGRDHYNEWAFVYIQTAQRPNQPGGATLTPGGGFVPGQGQGQGQGRGGAFGGPGQGGAGGRGNFQQPPPGFGNSNRPPIGSPGFGPGGQPFNQPNPFGVNPQPQPQPQPQTTPGVRRPPGQ